VWEKTDIIKTSSKCLKCPHNKKTGSAAGDIRAILEDLSSKVDHVIDLLQDQIVLQAASLNATNDDIRKALRLDMNRVSRISRLAKQPESSRRNRNGGAKKMPDEKKTTDEHLETIELLMAGILLNQQSKPSVKTLAKLIGVSDSTIADPFPKRKSR
jgi:hypothetical protein